MNRQRSRSLSTEVPLPIPVKATGTATSPILGATSPSSLSASLRGFSALSLSPPTTLDSEEFQKAYHHVRSSSFSSGAQRPTFNSFPDEPSLNTQLPGMSTSPTSAVSDSPSTPPLSTSPKTSGIGMGKPRATSIKSSGLDGVCEKEELEFDDLGGEAGAALRSGMPESAPAAPSPFANGARWGWPQSTGGSGLSSSPPQASHARRASLGGPAPMMAPLGRVVSAGAAPVSSGKGNDGLGLFRRLSVGGFGSRVSQVGVLLSFAS